MLLHATIRKCQCSMMSHACYSGMSTPEHITSQIKLAAHSLYQVYACCRLEGMTSMTMSCMCLLLEAAATAAIPLHGGQMAAAHSIRH